VKGGQKTERKCGGGVGERVGFGEKEKQIQRKEKKKKSKKEKGKKGKVTAITAITAMTAMTAAINSYDML